MKIGESYQISNNTEKEIVINGVTFYYDEDLVLTDDIIEYLEGFSLEAEDSCYTVCFDGDMMLVW